MTQIGSARFVVRGLFVAGLTPARWLCIMHPEFLGRVQAILSPDVEIGCAEIGLHFVMHLMRVYAGQRRLPNRCLRLIGLSQAVAAADRYGHVNKWRLAGAACR